MRVRTPTSSPAASTATASRARAVSIASNASRGSVSALIVTVTGLHHLAQLGEPVDVGAVVGRDDPDRSAVLDHDGSLVSPLRHQRQRLGDRWVRRQLDRGVEDQVSLLDPAHDVGDDGSGMSCGMTTRPPRRATVSAIRFPAIAVMFATTIGSVAPVPSEVVRSTS